ncbi:MAG: hypothetical protein P1U34_01350 [Coxiellaceae bacterium]|nr:hypothetical protein [Coxiellaceae bacterium]
MQADHNEIVNLQLQLYFTTVGFLVGLVQSCSMISNMNNAADDIDTDFAFDAVHAAYLFTLNTTVYTGIGSGIASVISCCVESSCCIFEPQNNGAAAPHEPATAEELEIMAEALGNH